MSAARDDGVWAVTGLAGTLTEGSWHEAINPGKFNLADSHMLGAALSWERAIANSDFHWGVEAQLLGHFGRQDHFELNVPLTLRYVPEGGAGVHGVGERTDGRDLIAEARALGYTVVRTRAQLLALPTDTGKVLGLFAHGATFNAEPEEELAEEGLGLYVPGSPTVAEMTEVALRVLRHSGQDFLLVVEEEATDNFGNKNNAAGVLEAAKRADDAIGVAQRDLLRHPDTLLITTADSDAGGMRMSGIRLDPGEAIPTELPERDRNGSPIDGVHGTGSAPFIAAADQFGQRHPFAISWATREDVGGGILVRADGLNSHRVRGSFDNTEIADLIALTLFGSVD